jgi:branched-chain amino acid transport system ATP-binding protein
VLRERLDHAAGALSGGQQQMLAIARGLMARPPGCCCSTSPRWDLAPDLVRETFEAVRRIRAEGWVCCSVEQPRRSPWRSPIAPNVLDRGRLVAEGPRRELAADPRIVRCLPGPTGRAWGIIFTLMSCFGP